MKKSAQVKQHLCTTVRDVMRFVEQMNRQHLNAFAAHTAFFFFLSLIPMLIMLCTLLPYTPLTEQNLTRVLTEITPDSLDSFVSGLVSEVYVKSAGTLSLSALVTLWSAGKGMLALMQGFNAIHSVEDNGNTILRHIVACVYTLIMLAVLVVSMLAVTLNQRFVAFLLAHIPLLEKPLTFFMQFRFTLILGFLVLFFAVSYTHIPNRKLQFKKQLPGAVFAAVAWSGFSWAFSLYASLTSENNIYGSLSVLVMLMLWMYFGMYIIMIGAFLNRELEKKRMQ